MERSRRVVVGVDGSAASLIALDIARMEAQGRGLPLEVVMAWERLDQPRQPEKPGFDPHFSQEQADAHLAMVLAGHPATRKLPTTTQAVCGHPAQVLLETGAGADLVVVGSRGDGGFLGLRLGSVSEKVVRHATVPVLVVPHQAEVSQRGLVVIGVDGSKDAHEALDWGLSEAAWRDSAVRLVYAWTVPAVAGPFGVTLPDAAELSDNAARVVEAEAARARRMAPHLEIETAHPCREPAQALIEAASDAGLLVVGRRGLGGFKGLLLGSVSHQVVHHAPCPVAVVRHG